VQPPAQEKEDGEEGPEAEVPAAAAASPERSPARGAGAGQPRLGGLKHSDSSFGLHSPDSLGDDVQVRR
jgi:hypothetical protein